VGRRRIVYQKEPKKPAHAIEIKAISIYVNVGLNWKQFPAMLRLLFVCVCVPLSTKAQEEMKERKTEDEEEEQQRDCE